MSGRPSRESVMTTLLSTLQSALQTSFTATTQAGSQTLSSPSTTAGLMVGLPVFGGSVPRGAIIQSLTPSLTLSLPAGANGTNVSLVSGFQTFGRRLKHWGQVSAQPALYLVGDDDENEWQGINRKLVMRAQIVIYSTAGENPDLAPVIGLNNLLDALDAAFSPDDPMQARFTLGGLLPGGWCRLTGRVQKEPGDLDGQAVAVADVEIIVP